jgi:hypothetical protein
MCCSELAVALQLLVVTSCIYKCSINPIRNPNPVCSRTQAPDSVEGSVYSYGGQSKCGAPISNNKLDYDSSGFPLISYNNLKHKLIFFCDFRDTNVSIKYVVSVFGFLEAPRRSLQSLPLKSGSVHIYQVYSLNGMHKINTQRFLKHTRIFR